MQEYKYEYKIVTANIGGIFSEANHHEVIEEHARQGWRLVQVLPVDWSSHGRPRSYETFFEMEIDLS